VEDDNDVLAMSVWESRAALAAAVPTMGEALKDVPFEEWESRPRELMNLDEFPIPPAKA
jgi:hypothetical protein